MSLFRDQDQASFGWLPERGASHAPPPARGSGGGRVAARYAVRTGRRVPR